MTDRMSEPILDHSVVGDVTWHLLLLRYKIDSIIETQLCQKNRDDIATKKKNSSLVFARLLVLPRSN